MKALYTAYLVYVCWVVLSCQSLYGWVYIHFSDNTYIPFASTWTATYFPVSFACLSLEMAIFSWHKSSIIFGNIQQR